MFKKTKGFFEAKREKRRHRRNYELKIDNVAIPEVHIYKHEKQEEADQEHAPKHAPINYDNVAIPEVHIRIKKK